MKRLLFLLCLIPVFGVVAYAQSTPPENPKYKQFKGQASAPANPPSGYYRLYASNAGALKMVDSAGTIVTFSTGGGTFPLLADDAYSVSTPSYSRSGDANTGVGFPAADTISLIAAGGEVARATAGKLDLGTGALNFGSAIATSTVGLAYSSAGVVKVTDGSSGGGGISALTFRTASPYSGTETFGTNPTVSAPHATIVGADCTAPEEATAVGYGAIADFRAGIAIGYATNLHGFSGISIGSNNAGLTAAGQVLLGSAWSSTQDFYFGPNIVGASISPVTWQTTGGSGADNAGATLNIASGKSTGSAAAPAINFQTSTPAGSSSTLQTLATRWSVLGTGHIQPAADNTYDIGDSTHQLRNLYVANSVQGGWEKTLTDNTATSFFTFTVPAITGTTSNADGGVGVRIIYSIMCTNSSHVVQYESGSVPIVAVNENGTVTTTVGTVGITAADVGGGTFANSFTTTVSGTTVTVKCTSDTSLTPVKFYIRARLETADITTVTGV